MDTKSIYALPADEFGWRRLSTGQLVKLGNLVTLGDRVTFTRTPVQVQCHPYIVYPYSRSKIGVGCVIKTAQTWRVLKKQPELKGHPECQPWAQYRDAIKLVSTWLNTYNRK